MSSDLDTCFSVDLCFNPSCVLMPFLLRATRRRIEPAVVNPCTFNSFAIFCHTLADLHSIPFIHNKYYIKIINCFFYK